MDPYLEKTEHIKVIRPPVLGWLMETLSDEAMDHLWKCIENRGESNKRTLAGNICESNELIDENNWFFKFSVGFGYFVLFLSGHITLSSFAEFSRPLKYYHKSCSILVCHAHALIGGHHCADCGDMKIELI